MSYLQVFHRAGRLALLLGLAGLAAGCRSGRWNGSGADVTGRVTLDGQAVGIGRILFYGGDRPDDPIFMDLEPDGTFQSLNVPLGSVRVAVQTSPYANLGKLKMGAQAGKIPSPGPPIPKGDWRPVPAKYEDPATSGLEYNITRGANKLDIALKSK
jgi:hypothetical protein